MRLEVGKKAHSPFGSIKFLTALAALLIFSSNAFAAGELRIVDDGGRLRTAAKLADGSDASVIVTVSSEAKAQAELSLNDAETNKFVQGAKANSDGIATFLGVSAGTYQLVSTSGARITGVQIAPAVRAAAKGAGAEVAAASAVGGASAGAITAGALAVGGLAAGVSESKKGNGGGDSVQQQPASSESDVRGGTSSHETRTPENPPPVGTISPAPGPGQTTVNDTPDNITGPNGPLPGSEDPTSDTPNPPAPQNPPPLSGS